MTKYVRIYHGFKLLNVNYILQIFKKKQKENFQRFVIENPIKAMDDLVDKNGIEGMLLIKYILKIMKFSFIIVHISFTVGMMWMIVCKFIEEFIHNVSYHEFFSKDNNYLIKKYGEHLIYDYSQTFIVNYDLQNKMPGEI
jgi:hypothetical protein